MKETCKEKISVVILCGGKSRRMGQEKGNLRWNDETFLERIVRNLRKESETDRREQTIVVDDILLSLRDEESGQKFVCDENVKRVYDRYVGCGPLAGIEATFSCCEQELIFVVACDMPFVDRQIMEELYRKLPVDPDKQRKKQYWADAVIPTEPNGRIHGLCGLYHKSAADLAKTQLEKEDYRVRSWLGQLNALYIESTSLVDGENKLRNINTEKDYKHMIEHKNIHNIPICSVVAFSGTGKTTFLEKLLPELKRRDLRVAIVKHDAHDFEIDKEGKDSYRMTQAGADVTALISDKKGVLMENRPVEATDLIDRIENVDLILTEGFKHGAWPKIMLHRASTGKPLPRDPKECMAVVSDVKIEGAKRQYGLSDVSEVAALLCEYIDGV